MTDDIRVSYIEDGKEWRVLVELADGRASVGSFKALAAAVSWAAAEVLMMVETGKAKV